MKLRKIDFKEEIEYFIYFGNNNNDEIDEVSEISSDIYELKGKKIKFKNLIFNSVVEFKFKKKIIVFERCFFKKDVKFKGDDNEIEFEESNFPNERLLIIVDEPKSKFTYNFNRIIDNYKITNFHCKNLTLKFSNINRLDIEDLIIENELKINGKSVGNSEIKDIYIQKCKINKLKFESFKTDFPKYIESTFSEFYLSNVVYKCAQNIHLPDCEKYKISNLDFNKEEINITYDKASGSLKILSFIIENINSKLISIEQDLSDSYDFFKINSDSQIIFYPSLNSENLLIKIETLKLVGEVTNLKYIKNVKVNNLELNGFIPSNNFTFDNISDKICNSGRLIIINSNLNNVTFKPSILHQFDNIFITKSDFVGMSLIGFEYIDESKFGKQYTDDNKVTIKTDNIEFFRFLKNYTERQNNLHLYQKYKAFEFNEMLRIRKDIDFGEKCILVFNKFTNNHTTDWTKAGKLFLIIFCSYFSLLLTYLYCSYFNFEFLQASKILPYLVSPVNLLMHYEDFEFHNAIYIIDFFYNLIIGLLLYQMIAAFRKFNK